ncbi:hypothetical protein DPV78_006777 [Talaromyces pinophilus]|nr:hypothetical protein DPV78_006777 [Talaromyces pinophilus]
MQQQSSSYPTHPHSSHKRRNQKQNNSTAATPQPKLAHKAAFSTSSPTCAFRSNAGTAKPQMNFIRIPLGKATIKACSAWTKCPNELGEIV